MAGEAVIGQDRQNVLRKGDRNGIAKLLLIEGPFIFPVASVGCYPDQEENDVSVHGRYFLHDSQDQILEEDTWKQ